MKTFWVLTTEFKEHMVPEFMDDWVWQNVPTQLDGVVVRGVFLDRDTAELYRKEYHDIPYLLATIKEYPEGILDITQIYAEKSKYNKELLRKQQQMKIGPYDLGLKSHYRN